jgi:hypothetical protein
VGGREWFGCGRGCFLLPLPLPLHLWSSFLSTFPSDPVLPPPLCHPPSLFRLIGFQVTGCRNVVPILFSNKWTWS